jgi:hypothetical protein
MRAEIGMARHIDWTQEQIQREIANVMSDGLSEKVRALREQGE